MSFGFILPEDFLIGTSSSAFQSEGAWDRGGKSPSIMDHYAAEYAGRIAPSTRNVAEYEKRVGAKPQVYTTDLPDNGCFFYDNYEAYIDDMAKTGQNVYRMSIAWSRLIPDGVGDVNPVAVNYYNNVINKLIASGITPFVDLCHWDPPQCLHEKGGYASPLFPEWFEAYARKCFGLFGDRVKFWSTFNESAIAINRAYIRKHFPPFISNYKTGQQAGQNVIIAHFRAVRAYKEMKLGGKIGSVNCIASATPVSHSERDIGAARRQTLREFDWWVQPMMEGTYPQELLDIDGPVRAGMPEGYQQELDKYFIPMDFIGFNYYRTTRACYREDKPLHSTFESSFYSAPGQEFFSYPQGLLDVTQYIAEKYHNPDMYITENGCAMKAVNDPDIECDDDERISYIREHLRMVCRAIKAGYNLKSYMYWNDADAYEQLSGYYWRFGLTWVDHATGERRWKKSRYYFSEICKTRIVD